MAQAASQLGLWQALEARAAMSASNMISSLRAVRLSGLPLSLASHKLNYLPALKLSSLHRLWAARSSASLIESILMLQESVHLPCTASHLTAYRFHDLLLPEAV